MTTGRINQVTTFRMCMQPAEAYCVAQRHRTRTAVLSLAGVRHKENINAPTEYIRSQHTITLRRSVLANMCQQHRPLVSRSHMFQVSSPCSSYKHRSQPSMRTTSNRRRLKDVAQSRRIPEWLFASGLAISN